MSTKGSGRLSQLVLTIGSPARQSLSRPVWSRVLPWRCHQLSNERGQQQRHPCYEKPYVSSGLFVEQDGQEVTR